MIRILSMLLISVVLLCGCSISNEGISNISSDQTSSLLEISSANQEISEWAKMLNIDENSESIPISVMKKVDARATALAIRGYEGLEFNGIQDVPIEYLASYIEVVARECSLYKEDENESALQYVMYDDIMLVLKTEFDLDDYPWSTVPITDDNRVTTYVPIDSVSKEQIEMDISPKAPGANAPCKFLSTNKTDNIVTVHLLVEIVDFENELADDYEPQFVDMEYFFSVQDDEVAVLQAKRKKSK